MRVICKTQRTDAWHQARKGKISGTAAGVIMGNNKYQTEADLIRQMVREARGAESEFVMTADVQRGIDREPVTLSRAESELGILFSEVGFVLHPDYDFIGCSPDGISETSGIEIKNPRSIQPLSDKPHYFDQIQLCMACTGLSTWHYVCDAGDDQPLHIEQVDADPQWFDRFIVKAEAFIERFLAELDNPAHLQPKVQQVEDPEWIELAKVYRQVKEQADNSSAQLASIKQRLIELSGKQSAEGAGLRLTRIESKGAVQYSKIPQLKGLDLDAYRNKPQTSYRITIGE